MARKLSLTRESLAQFLKDPEQIKTFENLFAIVEQVSENPDTGAISIEAGSAAAQANLALSGVAASSQDAAVSNMVAEARAMAALAAIELLSPLVDALSKAPVIRSDNHLITDYIELRGSAPVNGLPRTMSWSNADDTVVINHSDDVHQQVGLEMYVRFTNTTGVTIDNGTVLGLQFIGGVTTGNIVPFIANGVTPMLNIVGMATQDVPAGAIGRATVFGGVNGLDTTGTPYGEAWAAGDMVYASPTIAGGLTKVKPTAPAWAIPFGAVTAVSATVGRVFVRPSIDQPLYYGEFIKTVDTSPVAANTAYPVTFDSANIANGLSIGAPTSRIVAAFAGLFRFTVRMQMTSGSASVKNAFFWFRKNGVDIPNTCTVVSLDSGAAVVAPSINVLISLKTSDYIELVWASDSTNITLDHRAATAFAPASPAVVMVVSQEQQ